MAWPMNSYTCASCRTDTGISKANPSVTPGQVNCRHAIKVIAAPRDAHRRHAGGRADDGSRLADV